MDLTIKDVRNDPPNNVVVSVLGSLNTDLVVRSSRAPHPGETLTARSLTIGCGGKGANQAIAIRRMTIYPEPESANPNLYTSDSAPHSTLQADADPSTITASTSRSTTSPDRGAILIQTRMLGAVGNDAFGEKLLNQLGKLDGLDISGVKVLEGVDTGSAVITVDDKGQNSILVVPGANGHYGKTELGLGAGSGLPPGAAPPLDQPKGEMLLKGDEDILVCQLEVDKDVVMANLKFARENGTYTVLNPSPVTPLTKEELSYVDFLILNETETAILSGLPASSLDNETNPDRFFILAQPFLDAGVQHVIITRGAHGSLYLSNNRVKPPLMKTTTAPPAPESQTSTVAGAVSEALSATTTIFTPLITPDSSAQTQKRLIHHSPKVSKVVDTTCAGDTFLGTFVATIASTIGRHRRKCRTADRKDADGVFATDADLADGAVIDAALKLAHQAAGQAVQRAGAIDSIPYWWQLVGEETEIEIHGEDEDKDEGKQGSREELLPFDEMKW